MYICTNTVVTTLKNMWRFKKHENLGARKEKLVQEAGLVSWTKEAAC